jgi:Rad3-related DNA helicase
MNFYNMDIAEYYDEVQLTFFTEPIAYDYSKDDLTEFNMSIFERISENRKQDADVACLSPDVKAERNEARSLRRAVQTIYEYSRANHWDYFATFTLNDQSYRYDYKTSKNKLSKWFNHFKDRKCTDLKYLCVPEQHKDGAWHFHALLSGTLEPYIELNQNGYPSLSAYTLGFTTIEAVRDSNRVANYITKYVTKGLLSGVENAQRYFR